MGNKLSISLNFIKKRKNSNSKEHPKLTKTLIPLILRDFPQELQKKHSITRMLFPHCAL